MLFCLASESVYPRLKDIVSDYLACKKTKEEYNSQLENEQKEEILKKMEEASKRFDSTLKACYSILVKPRSKSEPILLATTDSTNESWEKRIIDALTNESLLIDSLGLKLLGDHGLLPTETNPVSVSQLYEAFLRFDDKPMILGPSAIVKTIKRYVEGKEFALASKLDTNFINIQFELHPICRKL